MGIKVSVGPGWNKSTEYLNRLKTRDIFAGLEAYGAQGVAALQAATPVDSSETANSWSYEIVRRKGYFSIRWRNTHVEGGAPIAVLLQYGHGTKNGGYVQGRDYINPAMRSVFDQIAAAAWKVVNS
jgi:hypothetical protein